MLVCPACRHQNPPNNQFCNQCATVLTSASQPPTGDTLIRIGRERDNHVRLPADAQQVARYQAEVQRKAGQLYIRDLGTRNGTMINGIRISGGFVTFGLHDEVRFGSHLFNTALLLPYLEPGSAPIPFSYPTAIDRLFQPPAVRTLLLVAGIALVALFFVPISIVEGLTVTAFTFLKDTDSPGVMRMSLILLPVGGVVLLAVRAMGLTPAVQGIAMIGVAVPSFLGLKSLTDHGTNLAPQDLESVRIPLALLMYVAVIAGLLIVGRKPAARVGRYVIAVAAPVYTLVWLFPVDTGYGDEIPLVGLFRALEDAETSTLIIALVSLFLLATVVGAIWFVTPLYQANQRGIAQWLAIALAAAPCMVLLLAIPLETGNLETLLTGVWLALFLAYCFFLPAFGAALLALAKAR